MTSPLPSNAGKPAGGGLFRTLRWGMRGALLLILLASLGLGWWGRRPDQPLADQQAGFAAVLTIDLGNRFGDATIYHSTGAQRAPLADHQAVVDALHQTAGDPRGILVNVAGGVSQGATEEAFQSIRTAAGDRALYLSILASE